MEKETRPYVPWDLMDRFMVDVFERYGVPHDDAVICADVLLESDRRGIESHGCNRFKPIYLDRIENGTLLPVTETEILKETPTTVVMDAHNGMGMVASHRMMERLIEKAKVYGMAGGTMTDSGRILKDMRAGNCALLSIGGLGEETGGYKGYGFTTIVEILSSALAGGPYMKELSGKNPDGTNRLFRLGHFFFVINPEFFMGLETFRKTAGGILRGLRASEKAPGQDRIYTAGEKEWLAWQDRKDKGVPVGESIQKELLELRDKFGLDYVFPFEEA